MSRPGTDTVGRSSTPPPGGPAACSATSLAVRRHPPAQCLAWLGNARVRSPCSARCQPTAHTELLLNLSLSLSAQHPLEAHDGQALTCPTKTIYHTTTRVEETPGPVSHQLKAGLAQDVGHGLPKYTHLRGVHGRAATGSLQAT